MKVKLILSKCYIKLEAAALFLFTAIIVYRIIIYIIEEIWNTLKYDEDM